ncbi:hypothetical protein V8C44DRAFT_321312 [Trichoderma aethiopicum]
MPAGGLLVWSAADWLGTVEAAPRLCVWRGDWPRIHRSRKSGERNWPRIDDLENLLSLLTVRRSLDGTVFAWLLVFASTKFCCCFCAWSVSLWRVQIIRSILVKRLGDSYEQL